MIDTAWLYIGVFVVVVPVAFLLFALMAFRSNKKEVEFLSGEKIIGYF